VGIKRLEQLPAVDGRTDKVRAELYCEEMSVANVLSLAPPPAATTGPAATLPAPAAPPARRSGGRQDPAPADTKAPAQEPTKTPRLPLGNGTAPAAAPAVNAETATNPEDKVTVTRDFPGPTARSAPNTKRARERLCPGSRPLHGPRQIDEIMAFYEKRLKDSGWEETARYENDNGTNRATRSHHVEEDIRTVSMTFIDTAPKTSKSRSSCSPGSKAARRRHRAQ